MRWTGDTITDEQIRALARTALTAAQHRDCSVALRASRETLVFTDHALTSWYPTMRDRRAARARCAALLNERAKKGKEI